MLFHITLPAYNEEEALSSLVEDMGRNGDGNRDFIVIDESLEKHENTLKALGQLARPKQWVKNSFVLVGMFFSQSWGQPVLVLKTLMAVLAFCFVSSAIYVLNDFLDRERDRLHPEKCHRPLASETVSLKAAGMLFLISLLIGLDLGWRVSNIAVGILLLYVFQNIAYSVRLKQVVMLDVLLIAFGFMLRILMGTWGVGIPPSKWLLLSGLTLALFMGFGKRWAELNALVTGTDYHPRPVLKSYSLELLNKLLGITACAVILTYSLYALDPSTILLHQTSNLIYTLPFVIYGLGRYLYLIRVGRGGDPTKLVTKDFHIIIAILLWLVSVLLILS
jgi:4-hydroxybenzoate polyprenyltransferase and related prenyltransferases